jgi:ubiquinone/menaquinone biosynthesis C-methylase UbiE
VSETARARDPDPVLTEYARLAAHYDTKWSWFIEASTRETLRRVTVRSTDRVLDVGCGTGDLLRQLHRSRPGARLVGVDPAPEMLDVARRKLPATVDLREAWAERLPYAEGTFDVVVSCNALHHMRDPVAALIEMRRVLRSGGVLAVTDWCGDYLGCRVRDAYRRLVSPGHVKVYRGEDCLPLLRKAGFLYADIDRYKVSASWGLMTVVAPNGARPAPLACRSDAAAAL